MLMYLVVAFLVAVAITEAFHDAALIRWKQNQSDGSAWHLWDSLSWSLIFSAVGWFAYGTWQGAGAVLVAGAALRLTLFAMLLNKIRGKPLFHLGTTNPVDVVLAKIGPGAHLVRIAMLALAGYLLVTV